MSPGRALLLLPGLVLALLCARATAASDKPSEVLDLHYGEVLFQFLRPFFRVERVLKFFAEEIGKALTEDPAGEAVIDALDVPPERLGNGFRKSQWQRFRRGASFS